MAEPDPSPAAMRDWGLAAPGELDRIVIVSPHLDDSVLGCSYLMAAQPGVTVITVFAGRPEEYPNPMERWDTVCGFEYGDEVHVARRAEDAAALATLDANPVWLDFVEHQYLDRPDWVGPDQTADGLEAALREVAPTAVFMPFGLANPDHTATHDAARIVRDRIPDPAWFCYEDMGYQHIPGLLAWRVAQLFRAEIWPTPAAPTVDAGDERKRQALAHYASQLRALEADWQIGAKLAAPAPEQFWSLDPPPPGWERLTRTP